MFIDCRPNTRPLRSKSVHYRTEFVGTRYQPLACRTWQAAERSKPVKVAEGNAQPLDLGLGNTAVAKGSDADSKVAEIQKLLRTGIGVGYLRQLRLQARGFMRQVLKPCARLSLWPSLPVPVSQSIGFVQRQLRPIEKPGST